MSTLLLAVENATGIERLGGYLSTGTSLVLSLVKWVVVASFAVAWVFLWSVVARLNYVNGDPVAAAVTVLALIGLPAAAGLWVGLGKVRADDAVASG